ncbi:hypothetical protein R3P38DRAFT_3195958 [Favolaschia claudopus]|uniref:F-box domain-containing protein n=1 Tax=Favolaschia claudopus TaxID=2862362 RepID=A0AAW0BAN1_9AGAR
MAPPLANELWYEICAFLPLEAIRNLSSTDHDFRVLVRPLGFSEYHVVPHSHLYIPPPEHLERASQRLDFYSSPEIAPHVRACIAKVPDRLLQSRQSSADGAPTALMRTFYDRLAVFTRLQRLEFSNIRMTQKGLNSICALPALTHLSFDLCSFERWEDVTGIKIPLRVVSLTANESQSLLAPLSQIISPDNLEQLHFGNLAALTAEKVGPFPHLHTLKVLDDIFYSEAEALDVLANFPAVRTCCIKYNGMLDDLTANTAAVVFPDLRKYAGNYLNLNLFHLRPALSHIMIFPLAPSLRFEEFIFELGDVDALPNITSFKAQFEAYDFGFPDVCRLLTLLPHLSELRLRLTSDLMDNNHGFVLLDPVFLLESISAQGILPLTLQTFSIVYDAVPLKLMDPAWDSMDFRRHSQ